MGESVSRYIPTTVAARHNPPLRCYYCDLLKEPPIGGVPRTPVGGVRPLTPDGSPALVTVHDQRGCYHVCFGHAQWRLTTSWAFGHSPDCPYFLEEGENG
jgi:hypothetical protein